MRSPTSSSIAGHRAGRCDRDIDKLTPPAFNLPAVQEGEKEPEYTDRVARENPSLFCHLHGKHIMYGGGRSRFELCDLLAANGDLVFIKRGRGPDHLSHLFAQALVSAELLMTRPGARKKADELISSLPFRLPEGKDFSGKNHRNAVYVIIGGSHKLPVFPRLNLRNAILRLSGYHWGVKLVFLPEPKRVVRVQSRKR